MTLAEHQIEVGKLTWFYREAAPIGESDRIPVVLLHGLVAQSYSWRKVMPVLAEQGFRAIAPDWIGHGFSSKPDRRDFAYTAEAFVGALAEFVEALGLERFHLVVQGFLGSVGLQYALRHPERVERLAILNAPIAPTAKRPWKIKQFGVPLVGDMLTQDPILVDRTLEGGGPYQVDDADLDVYRRPFLKSSDVGRALLATVQGLNLNKTTTEIAAGLPQWPHPTLLLWGLSDPWLPVDLAQTCVKDLQDGELVSLDQVGHYAQEDWAEKVAEALSPFLRKVAV
ncbi:MAG TPA: alpha/beta fold hydrolase [Trichocoleus sp.]